MTPPPAAAVAAPTVEPRPRGPLTPGRPHAPRPRRVSGPARAPARRPASAPRRSAAAYPGLAIGAIEGLKRLSTHPMLDRLIRGRTWIAIVAFALIGIVTLQLGLLKLNAGIGRSLRLQASLQRENAALSIENSELSAGDVVESRAGRLAMEVVPAGALRFLTARPGADAEHGAAAIKAPLAAAPSSGSGAEASSTEAAAEASKSASSGEAPAPSSESATSSGASARSTSESSEAKAAAGESPRTGESAPAGESSASRASAEPAGAERTPPAASPSGGGSTEPSGGTQAGTAGR